MSPTAQRLITALASLVLATSLLAMPTSPLIDAASATTEPENDNGDGVDDGGDDPSNDGSNDQCDTRVCGDSAPLPDAVAAIVTFVGSDGTTQVISTGSSVFAGCSWDRVDEGEELLIGRPDVASVNLDGSTFEEDHWIVFCPHLAAPDLVTGLSAYTIFPVGGPPPAGVVGDLIADAYSRTPVVAFNPITSPDGDDEIMLITRMTTFLWVDDAAWNTPVSATASLVLPGETYSVTSTATPAIANWSGGEEAVSCDGDDMHPYVFDIGGDDAQPSNCSMVYLRSSAVQDNFVEVEVTWDVAYTCNFPDCGGPLPDITITSTRPVTVGEILAVES